MVLAQQSLSGSGLVVTGRDEPLVACTDKWNE